ncbi:MAG TPA: hypothetical protein VF980_15395, partial [Thermoanaerobaculia bacterium]
MLTTIAAFVAGGLLVWALMASRAARAAAERDLARAERERSDALAATARRAAEAALSAKAVA